MGLLSVCQWCLVSLSRGATLIRRLGDMCKMTWLGWVNRYLSAMGEYPAYGDEAVSWRAYEPALAPLHAARLVVRGRGR